MIAYRSDPEAILRSLVSDDASNLDFRAIIERSLAGGAEYLLVEQDDLYGRRVFEARQTTYDNLVALEYSHLLSH